MLDKFAEELREARTRSGISLQQISSKTRIDLKFLEALDNGDFTFLPDPYVKAFLKEYAKMVGLDESKIISKYEAAKKGKVVEEESERVKPETQAVPKKTFDATPPGQPGDSPDNRNKKLLLYGGSAAVAVILLIYFLFFRSSTEIIITEKPIEEVIGNNRERFEDVTPDVSGTNISDSLTLTIFSNDTSWIKIILDDKRADEFILFPNSQKQVKTSGNFKITLGNAGGVSFQLNNQPLNFTGRPGAVQHVHIDKEGLKILQSPPTLNQE